MRLHRIVLFVVVCLVATACSRKVTETSGDDSVGGEANKPGSSLAYEHTVHITLPADRLAERMQAARAACVEQRFGACTLLAFEQDSGEYPDGVLTFRVLPSAVEPLAALAGEGGELASRQTRAEELAQAVADTTSQLDRLSLNRDKLVQLQARDDLGVADSLAVARELAGVEASLQGYQRTAADQTRRIETNLLTLRFSAHGSTSRLARLGDAFAGSLDSATEGVANAIEVLAYCLPLLIVAFPLALLWRLLWRRSTRQWAEKRRD